MLWSFINTGGAQIIAFVATTFIARIATPKDFGVFAIAVAIVLVANIFAEAGLSSTIIYDDEFLRRKKLQRFCGYRFLHLPLSLYFWFCHPGLWQAILRHQTCIK